jgi:hypothetical protein
VACGDNFTVIIAEVWGDPMSCDESRSIFAKSNCLSSNRKPFSGNAKAID